jgi:hypothetical protein
MFDFRSLFSRGVKPHAGAFVVVLFVVVVFFSAPFLVLWRLAKGAPGVGAVLKKIPGAAS